MKKKKNQNDKVLDFMKKYGSITPHEALKEYGVMRLASRISDLKKAGYDIRKEMVSDRNRDGEKVRYAKYSLNA